MSVDDEYLDFVRDLLGWVPELRGRRMFGGVGLYSGETMFALIADDTLYLKADERNRALYRDGGGEAFSYLRQGRTRCMGYWSVPADVLEDTELLAEWVRPALDAAR